MHNHPKLKSDEKGTGEYVEVEMEDQERASLVDASLTSTTIEVQVIAPATLKEGYVFETRLEGSGRIVAVTVPSGGVTKGETFLVEVRAVEEDISDHRGISSHVITVPRGSVPVGHWKDGMCNCLTLGLIHPVLCNAYFCPIILTAQIMHRLRLNWCARPTGVSQGRNTFWIVISFYGGGVALNVFVALMLGRFARQVSGDTSSYYDSITGQLALSPVLLTLLQCVQVCNYVLALYSLWIMVMTRYVLRQAYMIPTSAVFACCPGCVDDCCTIYFCNCCALSQMARHTANYDVYPGTCCTETGLRADVPSIV